MTSSQSSDDYQVLSAPEEGEHYPSLRHSHPPAFQVTPVTIQDEDDSYPKDDDEGQQVEQEAAEQQVVTEMLPTYCGLGMEPPDTPGPSEAPEQLVNEVYRDIADEPLLSIQDHNNEIDLVTQPKIISKPGSMKKTMLAVLMGVSLSFLASLLYFGNGPQQPPAASMTKPSPVYPQPHPTFFQPIMRTEPASTERTSLIVVAKRGVDFVWESKEVFQVRCLLSNWFQRLYQFFALPIKLEENDDYDEEDVLIVEALY